MPIIQNTVKDAAGNPLGGTAVTIELIAGSTPGFVPADDYEISFPAHFSTQDDGDWDVIILEPNVNIMPANTYYKVTEGLDDKTYNIIVPDLPGPLRVEDILAVAPTGPTPLVPVEGTIGAGGGTKTPAIDATLSVAYRTLTQPLGTEHYTPSIVAGKLRFTSDATTADNNHRMVAPLAELGIAGDSQMTSEWHAWDIAINSAGGGHQCGHAHRITSVEQVRKIGNATSATANTLTDTAMGLTSGELNGKLGGENDWYITITNGLGGGQTKRIISNTPTSVTFDSNMATTPDATSWYRIFRFNTKAIVIAQDIQFTYGIFHAYVFNGNYWLTLGNLDFTAYLQPGGTYVDLPWNVQSKVQGRTITVSVWAGADTQTEGVSGTLAIPFDAQDQAGMTGFYNGHLDASKYQEYGNIQYSEL